ncbi:MAG: retropepsin-like domain-containing protein [Candidatus Eremiobacteraeota bacterium]|nr:retropepsin-like domain-containing protein [Candidatus Eremiobacteraeota bacterium]MBV9055782.1 retropepsin-like domain-containing protein [Candidatus Eremiobacteraeota bacterium]MBV9699383.1 retropepsin-like domain-containing protein [Candidatus Eremiobacteraeota bacterium]
MTNKILPRFAISALCLLGAVISLVRASHPASAAMSSLHSGENQSRTTIPVLIAGRPASCVLDTGSSAMIVSPSFAQAAGLSGGGGTFELAPDGRTYMDRQTHIGRLDVAGHTLRDVPALISPNLHGSDALCGYDFFAHFPTLIDRGRHTVTLFPPSSRLAKMHCLLVDLAPHVPLATVEVNGSWLRHIVLDSGMAGGGALWDGVRSQLHQPLTSDAQYATMPGAMRDGFTCGAVASVRYAAGAPATSMPICTESQRPDGYNGILETNLPSVAAMAVDYPRRRMCFDVSTSSSSIARATTPSTPRGGAWTRFNSLRPPQ